MNSSSFLTDDRPETRAGREVVLSEAFILSFPLPCENDSLGSVFHHRDKTPKITNLKREKPFIWFTVSQFVVHGGVALLLWVCGGAVCDSGSRWQRTRV